MILLDTHIWLWWLLGDGPLQQSNRNKLDELAREGLLAISWVTLWETEMLERKGRIRFKMPFEVWLEKATAPEICEVIPVDIDTVRMQRKLPKDFHADPADRLITATAR
ncbi:PIN domain nuclease, a component of toxin-antitoxin system (PIN domain) [Cyclonatronum proteinivorum]|uniref:PIN domain nuclease, a component of toxin-antitoxin system (PIN domain) n=1 Tax=Cyclonatronum proteinivorum TaxID=1457365 RepID=A0A345UGW0_9BACT|nr:type II toxin-antitoxin system VapC family toxin [Cyclonatronum proteinivorum]AXI99711.1 PIN domain nuclease, a component of toxin-antitoxin system (PIN domain) [Cyclonatronum proteinivorum]